MSASSLTLSQLREARPELLFAAGRAVDAQCERLIDQAASLAGSRRWSKESWEGTAATLAAFDLAEQHARLDAAQDELRALGSLLAQAAEEFQHVRAQALAEPQATGGDPACVVAARSADERFADELSRSAAQALDGSGLAPGTAHTRLLDVTAVVAATLPPAGSSPAAVNAWWQRLDPNEQGMLLRDQPQLVGSLDGIPCAVRDLANRHLLDQLIDGTAMTSRTNGDALREGFLAIRARLQRSPGALLLGIGTAGQGRAVLAFGDPDTAANICAYVPGMGTRLADAAGKDADRALAIQSAAMATHTAAPSASTAALVWLGYDPPLQVVDAMRPDRAEHGAVAYDSFLTGLRATHRGSPPHLTALGHSYGSLLVGQAGLRQRPNPADEVVLIGSPGVGARHAADLGVAPEHVWVGAAPGDPVAALPSRLNTAVPLLSPLLPVLEQPLSQRFTGRPAPELWFGRDPADPGFGARRFPVDDGSGSGFASAHSHYLDPGSRSLETIARIVTGPANGNTAHP